MRWKIQLSYQGTHYCGWQKQPGDRTVQQTLEEAFSTIIRQPIQLTGCGRTDTGVHARAYVAHADVEDLTPTGKIRYQVNAVLPPDIAVHDIREASPDFHARFDALDRKYRYFLHFEKDPFLNHLSYYFQRHQDLDQTVMQDIARMLPEFEQFRPFCKTGSDAEHFKCLVSEACWTFEEDSAIFTIRSNRFLRGMVRLIVGTCLNAGLGKLNSSEVRTCLENQEILPYAWSVPPEGLYLEEIRYPIHPDTA